MPARRVEHSEPSRVRFAFLGGVQTPGDVGFADVGVLLQEKYRNVKALTDAQH